MHVYVLYNFNQEITVQAMLLKKKRLSYSQSVNILQCKCGNMAGTFILASAFPNNRQSEAVVQIAQHTPLQRNFMRNIGDEIDALGHFADDLQWSMSH